MPPRLHALASSVAAMIAKPAAITDTIARMRGAELSMDVLQGRRVALPTAKPARLRICRLHPLVGSKRAFHPPPRQMVWGHGEKISGKLRPLAAAEPERD